MPNMIFPVMALLASMLAGCISSQTNSPKTEKLRAIISISIPNILRLLQDSSFDKIRNTEEFKQAVN